MGLRFGLILGVAGGLCVLAACSHTVEGTGSGSSSSGTSGTSGGTSGTSGGGSTLVPIDSVRLCKLLVTDCDRLPGVPLVECVRRLGALRTTTDCANSVPGATCATLPVIESSCFAACSPGTPAQCLSEQIIAICEDSSEGGQEYHYACDAACRARDDGSWTTGRCVLDDDGVASCDCR